MKLPQSGLGEKRYNSAQIIRRPGFGASNVLVASLLPSTETSTQVSMDDLSARKETDCETSSRLLLFLISKIVCR